MTSRGNATPRETNRAYAMRVNGYWSSTWKKTAAREAALATTPKTLEYFLRANGVNSVPALGYKKIRKQNRISRRAHEYVTLRVAQAMISFVYDFRTPIFRHMLYFSGN